MRIMIASDIHGSFFWCEKLMEAYGREAPEKLLLLGDILYHGPRNDLPRDYAPKKVAAALNAIKDKILAVRGNCEAEVDSIMLDFPVMAEYAILYAAGRMIFATHGHHFGEDTPPPHTVGDILLNGHTHVPACRDHGDWLYINPGSVSIPKEDSPNGYMMLDGNVLYWKDLAGGETYREFKI